jgi:hypothetical protein
VGEVSRCDGERIAAPSEIALVIRYHQSRAMLSMHHDRAHSQSDASSSSVS